MHHNNFGNFYTREIYAILIPIGFIPISIPIPIMSCMAIPIPMGFPWEWDSHGVSHSHAPLVAQRWTEGRTDGRTGGHPDTQTYCILSSGMHCTPQTQIICNWPIF